VTRGVAGAGEDIGEGKGTEKAERGSIENDDGVCGRIDLEKKVREGRGGREKGPRGKRADDGEGSMAGRGRSGGGQAWGSGASGVIGLPRVASARRPCPIFK
jgi:hypothetical protein